MSKLKPCPFCGDEVVFWKCPEDPEYVQWICNGLDCVLRHEFKTEEEFKEAWNKRVKEARNEQKRFM